MPENRNDKRYYWLKLNENFFEREEIKIIEDMKNGKDYIIFYMKLLLKSIGTEGKLRFRDVIPYTPEMLSSVTNTDIDTVKVAINMFSQLGLMEKWDDGTLFMAETQFMLGSETGWAKKKRIQRIKEDIVPQVSLNCPTEIDIELELDKELELEIELEIDKDTIIMSDDESKFIKLLSKIDKYPLDRKRDLEMYKTLGERYPKLDLLEALDNWKMYKLDKPLTDKSNARSQVNTSFKNYQEWDKCLKEGEGKNGQGFDGSTRQDKKTGSDAAEKAGVISL